METSSNLVTLVRANIAAELALDPNSKSLVPNCFSLLARGALQADLGQVINDRKVACLSIDGVYEPLTSVAGFNNRFCRLCTGCLASEPGQCPIIEIEQKRLSK